MGMVMRLSQLMTLWAVRPSVAPISTSEGIARTVRAEWARK